MRTLRPSAIASLIALSLITQITLSQPRQPRFQHLTVEQGLSASLVFDITQDHHGFIWLATTDGLNRFDGKTVENFRVTIGNKNSLPGNAILCLFTDTRGIVWIGTSHGLARYEERSNSFLAYRNDPKDTNSLPANEVDAINEDNNGLLWIGTGGGLCSFDIKKNHFERLIKVHSDTISTRQIRDIKFAPDGTMWIATTKGLNRFDQVNNKLTSFFHDPADSGSLSTNSLIKMAMDKEGNLWMAFVTGEKLHLDCFNTRTYRNIRYIFQIKKPSTSPSSFVATYFVAGDARVAIFADRNGRLWLGSTLTGLIMFLPDKKMPYQFVSNPLNPTSLLSNGIAGIYQDSSGLIWLGTIAGAERFNPDESKFIVYRSQALGAFSPNPKPVQAIAEDTSHHLWIGTSEGLYILDRNTGTFNSKRWDESDTSSHSPNFVTSICRDKQGNMWVGTLYGLKMFDAVHDITRTFYAEPNNSSIAGNLITNIVCAKNGDLLIGGRPGLTIYSAQTHQFTNFRNGPLHDFLQKRLMNVVFEDDSGRIWLGLPISGLFQYNPKTGKVKPFNHIENDSTSLPTIYVCSVTQDKSGVIWVGTGAGLSRFNEKTQNFTTYTDKNGLANVRIKQLMVDDKNRIWMASNRGISVFNESRTKFTNYDPSDGLQGWEFSEPSAFKTDDGYFCFGGQNGFNMFQPDSLKTNNFTPPVVLRRISIFDQQLATDSSVTNLKSLHLSYKQNFFSFQFAALNYDHPEKNRYKCQLIGFDNKMVELGTSNTISYTNVPPADYTLKVMASNNDGVWNDKGFELHVTITPPFWATWWFRTLMASVLIGLISILFVLRENRIKNEQVKQTAINKQIAEIRMMALRAQMNPHFIFNSLNSIQHFISVQDKSEAINYLSKFSRLIRQILENSRENTVSISNELQLLELYIQLEQLRFNHKFDYRISVDEKIDTENTEIPPLLIQPYVENAILHGLINKEGKGELRFTMEKNNGMIICKIEDNGIGRVKASEIEQKKVLRHKSLGIKVTNERISTLSALLEYKLEVITEDLYDGKLANEEPRPAGTRVTITLPLKEDE